MASDSTYFKRNRAMASVAEKPAETQVECGVWDVTPEQYHADHSRTSNSMLGDFHYHPGYYNGKFLTRTIEIDWQTPATRLGSMKHIAALEPDRWDSLVEIIPADVLSKSGAKNTNAYKDWAAERPDKILAKEGELDTVRRMIDALQAHHIAGPLVRESGHCEQAIRWTDEATGIPCKSLRDKVIRNGRIIFDLKTCADNSPQAFSKAAYNFGYYRQLAFYLQGHSAAFGEDADAMFFIAVCKEPPYSVAVYELDDTAVELGRDAIRADLNGLARCLESKDWRAEHEKKPMRLCLPRYAKYQNEWEIPQ